MAEYMTIPKLAQKIGISDNTVRRYTKKYPQFFRKKMVNGWEHFPVDESIKLIQKINEISASGKRRWDVIRELKNDFNEVVIEEPKKEADNLDFGDTDLLTDLNHNLNRIANALEKIAQAGNA